MNTEVNSPAGQPDLGLSTTDPFETIDPDLSAISREKSDGTDESYTASMATLGGEAAAQIERIRESFSNVWESGGTQPTIAKHIPQDMKPDMRKRLVHELVQLDVEYRKQHGQSISLEDYVSQMPECRDAIESAFRGRSSVVPFGYGSVTLPKHHGKKVAVRHAGDPSSRYQPVDYHARGGLGVVYTAVDGELDRMVALKEIAPEHGDKSPYQDKFVFEAQVTGSLEHPGIVPVYGLGRYEDQEPFYAMRFIEGRSLKESIDRFHKNHPRLTSSVYYGSDFRGLLKHFNDTCNAIHYANDRGVVHRDIKPANVMLGNYGETLVVDWGLAKLVESAAKPPGDEAGGSPVKPIKLRTSGVSGEGSAVGTPMYMSPEQARGDSVGVDRRSDVYSLGALLFNMASGKYPIDGVSTLDVVMRVRQGRIRHLSEVAPHAPGALGSICRKAMALDPSDRYANAVELTRDLDRWVNSEQVQAHVGHEGLVERAGRLIRKHWNWAIPLAIALILLSVGATVATVLINGAKNEAQTYKEEAVDRYRDSRGAIDTWLVQSTDALEFLPGTIGVRQRLLEIAAEDYEKLSQRVSTDPELELERGRAFLRLGNLQRAREEFDSARKHYDDALDLFSSQVAPPDIAVHYQAEAGNIFTMRGLCFADEGKWKAAGQAYERAISELKTLVSQTDDALPTRLLAVAYVNAAQVSKKQGAISEAISRLENSIVLYQSLDGYEHDVALGIARARETLGRIHTENGDFEKALDQFKLSIESMQQRVDASADHPQYLDALASAHVSAAENYQRQGRTSQQTKQLQLALPHYRRLNQAIPEHPKYQELLAVHLVDLGITLDELGRCREAEIHLREALKILRKLVAGYGQVPAFRIDLAACCTTLGIVVGKTVEDTEAAAVIHGEAIQTLNLLEEEEIRKSREFVERWALAVTYYADSVSRQDVVAGDFFEKAISDFGKLVEAYANNVAYVDGLASTHKRFADRLFDHGQTAQARQQYTSALETWRGMKQGRTARVDYQLAWSLAMCPLESMRDIPAARAAADAAVKQVPENPLYLSLQALIAVLEEDDTQALKLLARADSLRGYANDRSEFVRGVAQHQAGRLDEALQSYERGLKWMRQNRPHDDETARLRDLLKAKVGTETENKEPPSAN